jgi:hypothetical protein
MLSVRMLNVVMLSDVMLSVVAHLCNLYRTKYKLVMPLMINPGLVWISKQSY